MISSKDFSFSQNGKLQMEELTQYGTSVIMPSDPENNPIDVMHIENYSQLGKICTQRCLELEDEALDWSFPIKF